MAEKEPKIMGTEEAVARLIQELVKTEKGKAKMLSDLHDREIGPLSILDTLGKTTKIKALQDFCTNFCQYRVSRFRLGRRELVNIASFTTEGLQEKRRKRMSIRDLIPSMR